MQLTEQEAIEFFKAIQKYKDTEEECIDIILYSKDKVERTTAENFLWDNQLEFNKVFEKFTGWKPNKSFYDAIN